MRPNLNLLTIQVLARAQENDPYAGVVADDLYAVLDRDPNVTKADVIAAYFAYIKLRHNLGTRWDADGYALKILRSLGAEAFFNEEKGEPDLRLLEA